jgi:hypothetical protein
MRLLSLGNGIDAPSGTGHWREANPGGVPEPDRSLIKEKMNQDRV